MIAEDGTHFDAEIPEFCWRSRASCIDAEDFQDRAR